MKNAIVIVALAGFVAGASADVRITEWMYNNTPEYVEFTNLGNAPVDFAGWSYDDDSRIPGVFSLSGFGVVQPGESVVITEGEAEAFRASWGLPASIKILGGYTNNLGRADEINLFNAEGNLVDRLTYGDNTIGGPRTQDISGVPTSFAALGANDVTQWALVPLVAGGGPYDLTGLLGGVGFITNSLGQLGNPGYFIPAPAAAGLLGFASLLGARRRR